MSRVIISTVNFMDLEPDYKICIKKLDALIKNIEPKSDIIVLPAGFFQITDDPIEFMDWIENEITKILLRYDCSSIICFGFDGRSMKDQLAVACSSEGIVAVGRKFYQTVTGVLNIQLANDYLDPEEEYSRIFTVNDKRFYLAVCYDIFGLKHFKTINPGCDAIINVVHGFNQKGAGNSGDVDFARKGFAGASKQWKCPVFAAANFDRRSIPPNFPTAVLVAKDMYDIKKWKYEDNLIRSNIVVTDYKIGYMFKQYELN